MHTNVQNNIVAILLFRFNKYFGSNFLPPSPFISKKKKKNKNTLAHKAITGPCHTQFGV